MLSVCCGGSTGAGGSRRRGGLSWDGDGDSIPEAVTALRHHHGTRCEPGGHGDILAIDHADGHGFHRYRVIGVHQINECGGHTVGCTAMHCGVGHDDLVLQVLNDQLD